MTLNATVRRSFPTVWYMTGPFRWVARTRRRRWTTALVLLTMIAVPVVWWAAQLAGLPDIVEPFDVASFRSSEIPDDQNAFVLYRRAMKVLKPLDPSFKWSRWNLYQVTPWPRSIAEARRWVEENREAMALYRQGTERPDALDPVPPTDPESWRILEALHSLHGLAQLEAAQLGGQGDMAGAWEWYRAALRATYHLGLRGTASARMHAQRWHGELRFRLAEWAADRRTSPALLRRALDDTVACGPLKPSESYTLKSEYLQLEQMLDGPGNPGRQAPIHRMNAMLRASEYRPSHEQMQAIADGWRFWRREPERSRRALRLVFANWLAYEALPADRRPGPDPNTFGRYEFHAFGPEAPAGARALSPEDLVRWLETTIDLPAALEWWQMIRGFGPRGYWLNTLGIQERASHRDLVVLLASELYRRDHGTAPPSASALVGPYLKELPDDGSGDAGDAAGGRAAGAVQ